MYQTDRLPKAHWAVYFVLLVIIINLASRPAYAAFPGLNGKIVYTHGDAQNNREIYTITPNGTGSDPTNLTNNSLNENTAVWSPDGTRIAYLRVNGGNHEIYLMDADGGNAINLTNNPYNDHSPSWSPDGNSVAYDAWLGSVGSNLDVYRINTDGSGKVRLTTNPADDREPAWSPDGLQVAFGSYRDGNGEIYLMNAADGAGQTNITNNPAWDAYADWAPDGSKIAFTSNRDGDNEIYVMDADGSNQVNLSNSPSSSEMFPAWSPDGSLIAFQTDRNASSNNDIYIMNADGTGQMQITFAVVNESAPDWQPLSISPVLTITGATADGNPMPGSLAGGYVLMTSGNAAANHEIAFAAGTSSNKPLQDDYFGLALVSSTVPPADLKAYYDARGVPEPYLSYLKGAADGTNPFVYIKGDGTTTAVSLADAAQHDLAATDSPMLVPDDYPPGTYIVQGVIKDLTDNETAVTLILVVMRSTCPGSDACMAVVPPEALLLCGDSQTVTFALNGVADLYGYQFDVAYDGALVTPTPSFVDGFFTVPTEPESHSASCASDSCTFFATKLNPSAPLSGSGPVAQIALAPIGGGSGGTFDMTISSLVLTTLDGEVIATDLPPETLHVTACGEAAVSGTINLQGRTKPFSAPVYHDPALVTLVGPGAPYGTYTAEIDPATGDYAFTGINVDPAGTLYEIRAAYDLYISNHKTFTAVPGANPQTATRLLGGDATLSPNQLVDIADLACIGGDFGKTADFGCDAHGSSDINDDGKINIQDLAISGGNYLKLSYRPW